MRAFPIHLSDAVWLTAMNWLMPHTTRAFALGSGPPTAMLAYFAVAPRADIGSKLGVSASGAQVRSADLSLGRFRQSQPVFRYAQRDVKIL